METRTIEIATSDGNFSAYLALPDTTPAPGILVIQEIFGINAFVRQVVESYAKDGYVAIAPDLFWRLQPGVELDPNDQQQMQQAFDLYGKFDIDRGTKDLITTLGILRNLLECNNKAGSIGFCLGGKLAYLMATRSDADCNVGYYGVGIEASLDEASNIEHPLLLHIAEEDQFVPKDAQARVKEGLGDHVWVTIYSYPGVNHGFARNSGLDYSAEAARLASDRTSSFFQEHLK